MKFVERLTFLDPARYLNPLAQLFFFITLANGFAYTFFTNAHSVSTSILYMNTLVSLGGWSLTIWGVLMILVAVLNTVALFTRNYSLGRTAAFLGVLAWFYAVASYITGAAWLQIIVYAGPNLFFWLWYYFAVSKYERRKGSNWLMRK